MAAALDGRVALVTGGAHRLGGAISRALAGAGMSVAVHYDSSADAADALVRELAVDGRESRAYQANLISPDAPAALVESVARDFGRIDAVVNSAAVMLRTPVAEVTVAEWDSMFALNLRAPFFLAQAAASWLRKSSGSIVNMADLAAFETWPEYIPHGITKAGIVQMTRALARSLAPDVRVNAIAPGAVLLPDAWDEMTRAHFASTTPMRRIGSAADVTDAVLYLLRAEYVTGETLVVDGGRNVRT
ncbi:MAG: SDR family oxidoreductase [Gemmatimonadota bacterium]|nr:SDR family oxidoreductase [Gemmatimonadota bacterium]